MRFFLVVSLCLSLAGAAKAAEPILTRPPTDADSAIVVGGHENVIFRVPSGKQIISCTGKFFNAEGSFDGPIRSSVRVKFDAAAEGKANPCEFTLTTSQGSGKPSVVQTLVLWVIVPKMVSRTLAHVLGTSVDRTEIGVGEEVMFMVEPKEWLLDSDFAWRKGQPWDQLGSRSGQATVYQALFPPSPAGKRVRIASSQSSSPVTLFIRNAAYDVTLFLDVGAWKGSRRRSSGQQHGRRSVSGNEHSPTVLAAAYSAKLDRLVARLNAHEFSTEPVAWMTPDDLHRQVPPSYLAAKGFDPVLTALASLQSRSVDSATGEQPEVLKAREIRLVARMVYMFHQALDSAYELGKEPPNYFAPRLPASTTILPGHLNIEGRYRSEDIRELELRRRFAKAIAENNAKIAYYFKQNQANNADDTLRRFAWDYLQAICSRTDPQLDGFKRELIALGADEKTAEALAQKPQEPPVEAPSQE